MPERERERERKKEGERDEDIMEIPIKVIGTGFPSVLQRKWSSTGSVVVPGVGETTLLWYKKKKQIEEERRKLEREKER